MGASKAVSGHLESGLRELERVVRSQGEGDVVCETTSRPLRQKEGRPSGPRERARGHEARRVLRVWLQACVVDSRLHIFDVVCLVLGFFRLSLGLGLRIVWLLNTCGKLCGMGRWF
jgi:hypothetical protein